MLTSSTCWMKSDLRRLVPQTLGQLFQSHTMVLSNCISLKSHLRLQINIMKTTDRQWRKEGGKISTLRDGELKSHLLLYYFAVARIASEHTNTSKNVEATLTVVMPCIIMQGLSSAGSGSLHDSIHPLEREINPLKMPCGCPRCGATKTSHSRNPIALCSALVNVLLHIPRVQLGNDATAHLLLGLKLPSQAKPSTNINKT